MCASSLCLEPTSLWGKEPANKATDGQLLTLTVAEGLTKSYPTIVLLIGLKVLVRVVGLEPTAS